MRQSWDCFIFVRVMPTWSGNFLYQIGLLGLISLLCWQPNWFQGSHWYSRADSRFAPSQWETVLLCNNVPHWLGASLKSALYSHLLVIAWDHDSRSYDAGDSVEPLTFLIPYWLKRNIWKLLWFFGGEFIKILFYGRLQSSVVLSFLYY